MQVIKRDGREVIFDSEKVMSAISAALVATNDYNTEAAVVLKDKVIAKLGSKAVVNVSDIHTTVEDVLMKSSHKSAARAYIEYRSYRDSVRESNGKLFSDITGFLEQTSDEFTKENANKDSKVVNTHRDLLAGIISKHYAMNYILPEDVAEAHREGFIHAHDLDYILSPLTNCALINYQDMLDKGFHIGNAEIESPKSIGVAATVLTQIIQAVASSAYGGQTSQHIDKGLSKYVELSYKKNLAKLSKYKVPEEMLEDFAMQETEKDVDNAMQTLFYQVNTLMTTNGQAPFITISMGLDTSVYGRMITKAYLEVHKRGLGVHHTTAVFPKVIFFLKDGVNLTDKDPNYDLKKLAMECCVERIYPDFISSPLNKKVTGSCNGDVTSMSCRSFLSKWEDENGVEKYDGRFNLGVVTLNLALIAKNSQETGVEFYTELDKYLELSYKAHMVRVNRLKGVKAKQNPIMFVEGALARLDPEECIDKLFYDGYASISIGYGGLAEACEILYGVYDKQQGINILKAIKNKCEDFNIRSGLAFSEYGSPIESGCYKFAKALNKKYPGTLDRDYVTNSFHQPVWVESTPIEKWEFEEGFAEVSSGGNIGYVETPNLAGNMKALESLVDYGYKHIPYFGINQPIDHCFKCEYSGEFNATPDGFCCPQCGNTEDGTMSVIRRVSGYLSAPNARPFNLGKMQETIERVKHQ